MDTTHRRIRRTSDRSDRSDSGHMSGPGRHASPQRSALPTQHQTISTEAHGIRALPRSYCKWPRPHIWVRFLGWVEILRPACRCPYTLEWVSVPPLLLLCVRQLVAYGTIVESLESRFALIVEDEDAPNHLYSLPFFLRSGAVLEEMLS
eukprot:GHVT01081859.1.p1 GENE.GHVT01081859.1~~GHVT01081859.1.p1  ORF type:complete len:149 (+),score=14.33 GHVT01081859.1:339-785(+)